MIETGFGVRVWRHGFLLVGRAVLTMRVDAEAECNMLKGRTLASSEAKM